jgi:hypothetical protein
VVVTHGTIGSLFGSGTKITLSRRIALRRIWRYIVRNTVCNRSSVGFRVTPFMEGISWRLRQIFNNVPYLPYGVFDTIS